MNRKTTYLIPAFVAVFALMFTFATPLALAEYSEGMHGKEMGQKHYKMHKMLMTLNSMMTMLVKHLVQNFLINVKNLLIKNLMQY